MITLIGQGFVHVSQFDRIVEAISYIKTINPAKSIL
jgi:hypothetical protein